MSEWQGERERTQIMHSPSPQHGAALTDSLRNHARAVADHAAVAGGLLMKEAKEQRRQRARLRAIDGVAGLVSAITAFSPTVQADLGTFWSQFVIGTAPAMLLATTIYYAFKEHSSPEHMEDHATGLIHYANLIYMLLADGECPYAAQQLKELLGMTFAALEAAERRWPEIVQSYKDKSGNREELTRLSGLVPNMGLMDAAN